ncbi:MAG: FG-GAP-like repeat-containing protein [Bacteroidota bacterium]
MTSILNNTWGSTPCVADMDGDGLDDVVTLINGNDISIDYQQPDGSFDQVIYDVNAQVNPSWSIAAGDLNADGYLDLMFGGGSRVAFYVSNSNGTAFTEQFIDDYIFSQRTNIVDIDNDGDLDAFACHDVDLSHPYRNDGNGNMTEDQSLIATVPLAGNYASVWTDFDNDGDTDLYIAKCQLGSSTGAVTRENALYVNDGSGNYSGNVSADYGLFDNEQSWVTIFEDFDNDGDMDVYTVNHTNQNYLRENDGTGNFTDISVGSGLDISDIGAWALIGADFDNDGYVDMLMESRSFADIEYYHNDGDMTFTGSSLPFDKGALGDLNNDGYIDVFTGGTLWMNDGGSNSYLKVALTGTNSNINGIGARVECYSDMGMQIRECRAGENFKPMSSLDVFFGLGTDTEVDSVIVRWPSGQIDVVVSPQINSRIQVLEGLLPAVVRLIDVDPTSQEITIKNFGGEPADISGYRLCSNFSCNAISALSIINGDLNLSTGEEVTLSWTGGSGFSSSGADMSLFLPMGSISSASTMVDFMQYGSSGNGSESVAVTKGIWGSGDFVPLGFDYFYTGSGFQDGVTYWDETPFCLAPTDGVASNLSVTGADLSWTENGSATSWDIEIGVADFTPTGTPTASGVSNPYPFSGTQGTVYDFYVRSNCGASGGIGLSDWAGPFRFTVPLPQSACEVAIDVSAGGTFNTGFIDGIYDNFESCMASSPNNGNWFIYSASVNGTLNISSVGIDGVDTQVSVGVGTCGNLTEIDCNDDFTGSPPWESEVEFEVTAGTDYYIMWGDGWTANASNFTVTLTPDFVCLDPSNLQASNLTLTNATISWDENGTATSWDLEIGNEGFTPSGNPTNSSVFTSYVLSGSEGESLDVYVRSDCGQGGFSNWVGPINVVLLTSYPGNQWLDFSDATPTRLSVTTVANSDDEEKDIAVADLDNDGFDDVIVVRKEPFLITQDGSKSDLLLMNENGVLTDRTTTYAPEFISTETFARDIYIDDFDGDGWKDVIIATTFEQQPRYYANQGEDGSGNWLGLVDESSSRFPTLTGDFINFCGVTGGDINGDTYEDIYFVNYRQTSGQGVAKDFLLINDGTGVFTEESDSRLGTLRNSAFGASVEIHDLDNDGDDDILKVSTLFAVLPWGESGIFALFNNGSGSFTNWQNIAPGTPYTFEVADFNTDGLLDVFVVDDNADYLLTANSVNANTSINYTSAAVVNGLSSFGGNVHAVDLDNDGDLDLAVSDVVVDIPPCNSDRRLAILENQNGVFIDHHTEDVREWEVNSYDICFADINGDGLQDIFSGGCSGFNVFMSDNCELVTSSADFDLDGLPDACDDCPTNPDPACEPEANFPTVSTEGSAARQWNELLLESIRRDFARPTVHARNLFHTSMGMWDAWAAYDETSCTYLLGNTVDGFTCDFDPIVPLPNDVPAARAEAISYMAYRLLSHRFAASNNASLLQMAYDAHMSTLGYDINVTSVDYSSGDPAALGNYIAECIINFGLQDGSNEQNGYVNQRYEPVNPPMIVKVPGNSQLEDWNRWQPLSLDLFIDQSGNEIPGSTPEFLSPEWGQVSPFALEEADKVTYNRDNFDYEVYHDPGAPPLIDTTGVIDSEAYRWGFITTLIWSAHLDATDGVMWDISPASIGKRDMLPETVNDYPSFYNQIDGGTASPGHAMNPATGMPYTPNMVPRADYARVLAEFWADGPDSETPPGHWFSILNYVSDHEDLEKRFMGEGPLLEDLEWDVKSYFMLGGAMHDAAVSTWGVKGWYDYLRPISAIRAMAGRGQSTNPGGPSYHPAGVPLIADYIEVIQLGDPLAGDNDEFVGDIKVKAWRGHKAINNVDIDEAGVGWIHASEWEPYQRPSFVTPPFAGYVSGHSTFSRAAAEVLTSLTGDSYFPGGMGTFIAEQDDFLVFEDGPSMTIELQWATYQDAADESGLSRIWGGIHPPCDDIPGRKNGITIGQDAFAKATSYFGCSAPTECEAGSFPAVSEESLVTFQLSDGFATIWDAVPGQIGCQIQVRFASGSLLGAKVIGGTNASSFGIPYSVLQPGTDYEWRVRCGCSQAPLIAGPFSSWQLFTTPGGSNLTSNPNPTEGQSNVTFSLAEEGFTTLKVYDLSGRMVEALYSGVAQAETDYRFEFDGSALPNGVYIYRLTTGDEIINEKFMIAR